MLARDLMSDVLITISPSESAIKALNWMEVFRISHLPVVQDDIFLGLLSDSAIYDSGVFNEPIQEIADRYLQYYVTPTDHIFELIDVSGKYSLSVVPVVDPQTRRYAGMVLSMDLIRAMASILNSGEKGAILITELHINDYSLSQIAQIVESNDAKIISLFVTHIPDSMRLSITIRVNTNEITSLLRTFERYNYEIQATFEEQDTMQEILKDRYEALIRYLNI